MNNLRRGQISNKRDYVRQCLYCEKIEVISRGMICRYRGNIIGSTKHILTRTDYKQTYCGRNQGSDSRESSFVSWSRTFELHGGVLFKDSLASLSADTEWNSWSSCAGICNVTMPLKDDTYSHRSFPFWSVVGDLFLSVMILYL